MIKGITLVNAVGSQEAFDTLSGLFSALGFEGGKGWEDAEGRGAAFLAPVGNFEIVTGRPPAVPPVLIEVTQLDAVRATVAEWAGDSGLEVSAVTPDALELADDDGGSRARTEAGVLGV